MGGRPYYLGGAGEELRRRTSTNEQAGYDPALRTQDLRLRGTAVRPYERPQFGQGKPCPYGRDEARPSNAGQQSGYL